MRNSEIIFTNALELAKKGIIGTTGNTLTLENDKGETIEVPEPEHLDTYAGWKRNGYQVQKGQKARASFKIWKPVKNKSKSKNEDVKKAEERGQHMILVTGHFFTADQVQKIDA